MSGIEACANCGTESSDAVKLKNCTACCLVKYFSVDCQKSHRKQHKKACTKRAAELKDEQLYSQGQERPEVDFCPICTLAIPFPVEHHAVCRTCCMSYTCNGCNLAAHKRGMFECAFCRTPLPRNNAHGLAMLRVRVEKKDPDAITILGGHYCHGNLGLQKDVGKGVELYAEAAELGSIEALFNLGVAYSTGQGVEEDEAKSIRLYEKAAMLGHVDSRYQLGNHEGRKGSHDRAVRHFLISAKMGHKKSLEMIKNVFMGGDATKEQYAQALKGYQDAVEEMKSHDREEAKRRQIR